MGSQTIITISQVGRLAETSSHISTAIMERVDRVSHISVDLVELRASELALLLSTNSQEKERLRKAMDDTTASIDSTSRQYGEAIKGTEQEQRYKDFMDSYSIYRNIHSQMLALEKGGLLGEAANLFTSSQREFDQVSGLIHSLRHEEYVGAMTLSESATAGANRTKYLLIFAFLVVTVIALGLEWYISHSISTSLGALLAGTRRVARGDFSQPVKVYEEDEFADLARSFNAMMESIKESQAENTRLTEQALKMREEHIALLRERLTRVVKAQEDERQRVARELHDQAGQALTALQFGLTRAERACDSPKLQEELEGLRTLTVETMNEVRNLALDLRPSALDELGLVPALRAYVRDYSKRVNIPIDFEVSGIKERLPSEMEIALFRVIQEGLTNVAKHSQATQAWIKLAVEDGRIKVKVFDNGRGFDVEKTLQQSTKRSLGLFGINERVELLGGSFRVESAPGKGTTIFVEVPVAPEVAAGASPERTHPGAGESPS